MAHNNDSPPLTLPHAVNSIIPSASIGIASSLIDAVPAVARTQHGLAPPRGRPMLTKPLPWTPLRPFVLERELSYHPDQVFVRQLIDNLQHGCEIGYTGPQFTYLASNLESAYQQPHVIDATLKDECEAGRILGPFDKPPLPNFRTSGLGLVPKHDGGWRIIYHLSAPPAQSINDYIDPQLYSLSYCTIDDAYTILNKLGPGALMNLLGICWRGQYFIDTCLPFGLRSAPYLFNQLSTAIHWILQQSYGVQHLLHYLDDFFTAGPAASAACSQHLQSMLTLCEKINAPIKLSKVEGPTTSLTFLGIHLNTITMEASISDDRKRALLDELRWVKQRDKCTKRELLSLIGKLSFCCKVLPAGRIFLRRMIDLSTTVSRMHYRISLNTEAKLDLQWWLDFLPAWSGKSLILNNRWTPSPALNLYTDASGRYGWGAYWDGRWLQCHWSLAQSEMDITWKELFAIVLAVHTWGSFWSRKKILFHCDNQAVVDIWDRGSTRAPHTMALVRLLYFCASNYNINLCIIHIPGICNDIADSISRFQMERFRTLTPNARSLPDHIPAWPMQSFTNASCNAGIMALPSPRGELTNQDLQSSTYSVLSTSLPQCQHHP